MLSWAIKKSPPSKKSSVGRGLVGDFQFHAAVDDIGGQAVQFLDLHIAATLTEVLDGNIPESITLDHGMYLITRLGGISGFQVGCLHRGHDSISAILAPVDYNTVTAGGVDIPSSMGCLVQKASEQRSACMGK